MKIESVEHISGETFVVTIADNGIRQAKKIVYSEERFADGTESLRAISSKDAAFHDYISGHREFRAELFRLVREAAAANS